MFLKVFKSVDEYNKFVERSDVKKCRVVTVISRGPLTDIYAEYEK